MGPVSCMVGPRGTSTFPEAVCELSLGIYLIVKGFKAAPGFFADAGHGRVAAGTPAVPAQ
jgi:hypothetical protein